MTDPIIVALLGRLPETGAHWPLDERLTWLRAIEATFDVVYGREPAAIFIKAEASSEAVKAFADAMKKSSGQTLTFCEEGALKIGKPAENHPPIEPKEPAAPMVDPPKAKQVRADRSAPHPRVGARRPEGIPTTFTMVQTVLKEATAFSLTAHDVMAKIEERWWPGLGLTFLGPDISSFITMYRLTRNADGKLALTEKGASMISEDLRHRTKGEFQEPKRSVPEAVKEIVEEAPPPKVVVAAPKPKPALQPRPSAQQPVKFDHNDKTTYLATMREYVIAGKLRAAMGKGHVGEAFLASEIIGSNTETNRDAVRIACRGMNESLAEVGLVIEYHAGYGLLMKELA